MKKYGKIAAALLAVMISASATGMYAMANKSSDPANADDNSDKKPNKEEAAVRSTSDGNVEKSETVYVITD